MIGRLILGISVFALCCRLATAQSVPLTDKDKEDISHGIAKRGLNCPIVSSVSAEGEGPRGSIKRVSCKSSDGKQSWDLRVTKPPLEQATIEPW